LITRIFCPQCQGIIINDSGELKCFLCGRPFRKEQTLPLVDTKENTQFGYDYTWASEHLRTKKK